MSGNYVLCHSAEHVRLALATAGAGRLLVVAQPDAAWEAREHGVAYVRLEDFDKGDLAPQFEDWMGDQIEWAVGLDAELQRRSTRFKEVDFRPARQALLPLKNAWDEFVYTSYMLASFASDVRPDNLEYFVPPRPMSIGPMLEVDGSVASVVLPRIAQRIGFAVKARASSTSDLWWRTFSPKPTSHRRLVRRVAAWPSPGNARRLRRFVQHARHSSSSDDPLVLCQTGYDITQELLGALREHGVSTREWSRPRGDGNPVAIDLAEAWSGVNDAVRCWDLPRWRALDVADELTCVFRAFWFELIPRLWAATVLTIRTLEARRPVAVVGAHGATVDEVAMIIAARSRRIPVVMFQHGASVGDLERGVAWDVQVAEGDHWVLYGEGAARYVETRPSERPVGCAAVGSVRIDRLRAGAPAHPKTSRRRPAASERDDRPRCVYVADLTGCTPRLTTVMHQGAVAAFELRSSVLAKLATSDAIRVAYKPFVSVGRDPTDRMMRAVAPTLERSSLPLSELQWTADVLVYECPSTGMFEGLLTDAAMVVYADAEMWGLTGEALALLRRRAAVCTTREEFLAAMEALASGKLPPKLTDTAFRRAFVTHRDDGQAARRAADVIAYLAGVGPPPAPASDRG